jgi:hypothetical protein
MFLAAPYNRLLPYNSNMYIRDMILFLQSLWHAFINNFTYGKSDLPKMYLAHATMSQKNLDNLPTCGPPPIINSKAICLSNNC